MSQLDVAELVVPSDGHRDAVQVHDLLEIAAPSGPLNQPFDGVPSWLNSCTNSASSDRDETPALALAW